jgi:CubicO group peptidase (beta-lactamase class C family)
VANRCFSRRKSYAIQLRRFQARISRQIVSEKWIQMARTPGVANPDHGYMNWFLNADLPAAPKSSVTFRGAGDNIVYIDWENDLVVVVRWIDRPMLNAFVEKVVASVKSRASAP